MKNTKLKQIVTEAVERFAVMEIHGERNEINQGAIAEWIDRNFPVDVLETQKELINVLYSQVVDLSMMSKIELGDDVIEEIKRLKTLLKNCQIS